MVRKKIEIDRKFIRENFNAEDCRSAARTIRENTNGEKAFTTDYVRMVGMGIRNNDEIVPVLQKAIEIRLRQEKEKMIELKKFNFNK